tara:strand:- start:15 stop:368 length:354 start_codon:yes stop_codon:yes gene_type:complete
MKVFNLKTNGKIEIMYEGASYIADTSHPDFSTDQQNALAALVTEIQTDGYNEIHIETNGLDNFVHKRATNGVDASDNVNSYQIFVDLGEYAEALKPSHAMEEIDNELHPDAPPRPEE